MDGRVLRTCLCVSGQPVSCGHGASLHKLASQLSESAGSGGGVGGGAERGGAGGLVGGAELSANRSVSGFIHS